MSSTEPFIICSKLIKLYTLDHQEVMALQGLDLVIYKGELVGIAGSSGSGKSTLLNILGGLDRPTAGRVWVGGQNLLHLSDAQLTAYRRNEVGFVWQQGARNLIPLMTAVENVELPMILAGRDQKFTRSRAQMLLKTMGLGDRAGHSLHQLSGGEQQRVAVAVALANEPRLVLADEPSGELDTNTAQTIYHAFQQINREFGVTTLIVSHDAQLARHVQRVISVRDGRTSSETVRIFANGQFPGGSLEGELDAQRAQLEERLVIDPAGRLQLPHDLLQEYGITGRAQIEKTREGILIRRADHSGLDESAQSTAAARTRRERVRPNAIRRLLNRLKAQPKTTRPEVKHD